MIFVATKKGRTTYFFTPLFCCCLWIREPGWTKSGSGIRDKHHGSATLLTDILGRLHPSSALVIPAAKLIKAALPDSCTWFAWIYIYKRLPYPPTYVSFGTNLRKVNLRYLLQFKR
jgi:hypothetical protein